MNSPFDRAANESPRSGSSKTVSPVTWAIVLLAAVAIMVWFAIK